MTVSGQLMRQPFDPPKRGLQDTLSGLNAGWVAETKRGATTLFGIEVRSQPVISVSVTIFIRIYSATNLTTTMMMMMIIISNASF
jgi:hypothetical protein